MRQTLLLISLLGLVPLAGAFAAGSGAAAGTYVIHGEDAGGLVLGVGGQVVDDHGAFVTAELSGDEVRELRAAGALPIPIAPTSGRGAFVHAVGEESGMPDTWETPGTAYSLVTFRGPIKASWQEDLARVASVFDYLPGYTYLVRGDRAELGELPGVEGVEPYHAGYRVGGDLLEAQGPLELTLLSFPDVDQDALVERIAATGATVRSHTLIEGWEGIVRVHTDGGPLEAIARLEGVSWIEPAPGPASLDNEQAAAISQSGDPNQLPLPGFGIDGSTQLLSVCDTGVDTTGGTSGAMVHEMFSDPGQTLVFQVPNPDHRKVVLYYAAVEDGRTLGDFDDANGHGTHTAGTVAGNAPGLGGHNLHDAGAYNAKLAVCDITDGGSFLIPDAYETMWDPAYDLGSRVNSNSWGSTHTNTYTDLARQHDIYVWEHRDFTILRSAGNTGPDGQLRPEGVAKNVFSVGSSKNDRSGDIEDLSRFSTRGLAHDGRIKPDIVAPGECLMSASRGTTSGYRCLSGTSMSTPTAAAAVGLVRDYFEKGTYPTGLPGTGEPMNPSHALIRAVLFAGGYEMTGQDSHDGIYAPQQHTLPQGPVRTLAGGLLETASEHAPDETATFPNANIGWGRVWLDKALHFQGQDRGLWVQDEAQGLVTGEEASFQVDVSGDGSPVKVLLAWTDFPAAAGADPALVNDLDLTVTSPLGAVYQGNTWLGNASVPSAALPDQINNAESVHLPGAVPGTYTVTVTGANVPQGPQPYAAAVVGSLG